MAEQYYPPQTMYPAEGRSDIAEGLEEEQLHAYSARHARASSQQGKATQKAQQQSGQKAQDKTTEHYYPPQTMHPAEGRSDVAEDLEEEQRNAYSAHHKGTAH